MTLWHLYALSVCIFVICLPRKIILHIYPACSVGYVLYSTGWNPH